MKTLSRSIVSLVAVALVGCATPPPTGGYSKDEQRAIREEQRARRAAWRSAGLNVLNFGLGVAANTINGGAERPAPRGFAK